MKTLCKNGHPYDPVNTGYNSQGYYFCIQCKRKHAREYANRKYANDDLFREAVKESSNLRMKQQTKELRKLANEAYGGKCCCCGESTPEFLHLDHVADDGAEHRRELSNSKGGSIHTLRWARNNNWPDRLQLLCHNCGMAKAFYGACPHNRKSIRGSRTNVEIDGVERTTVLQAMRKCSECGKRKDLTPHGTCFKCHIATVNVNARIEARK